MKALGKFVNGKSAPINIKELVRSRMLVQSNSGGGKSWLLRKLNEISAGVVQQIVIDVEGEFSSLREKFDYIIAAPTGGDAMAHPKTAKLLAIRLLETGVSAIIDISELKRHEQQTFVRLFFDAMIAAPKTLWHDVLVYLDEAQLFCPEKGSAEASGAVIDMASLGRKRGFALIAATQRLAKFNKDAAAELANKLIGRTGLVIDVKRAADELGMTLKEAIPVLRNLEAGEFFGFGPALSKSVEQIIIGDVITTHPKPGQRGPKTPPKPTPAIKEILAKLADLPKEAEQEARSIDELRRELATVRRELTLAKKSTPAAVPAETAAERRATSAQIKNLQGTVEKLMKFIIQINAVNFSQDADGVDPGEMAKAMQAAVDRAMKLVDAKMDGRKKTLQQLQQQGTRLVEQVERLLKDNKVEIKLDVEKIPPYEVKSHRPPPAAARPPIHSVPTDGSLPKGEAAILAACIMYPEGASREQLTILTGYKRSSRDTYIQRLRERGFVESSADLIKATDAGCAALPNAQPLPVGEELRTYWLEKLPEGERKILEILIAAHPQAIARQDLDGAGYQRSSRDTYLQRLRARGLISEPARGQVAAVSHLFS